MVAMSVMGRSVRRLATSGDEHAEHPPPRRANAWREEADHG